jgi:hypothetical protein
VHRVRLERDVADFSDAARLILAFKIAFQYQPIIAQHDEPVQIPDASMGNSLVEPRFEIRREACVPRGDRLQSRRPRG